MKRWPLYNPYFWESAPFFRILLPLAAGIFCYDRHWLFFMNGSIALGIILIAACVYSVLTYSKKVNEVAAATMFIALHLFIFCSGFSLAYFNDIRNSNDWFGKNTGSAQTYLARITEAPVEKENSWKIPLTVINSIDNGTIQTTDGKALLYLYKDTQSMLLHKGDSILLPGNWQPIKNAGNPFEFDYAGYCRRNNICGQQACSVKDIRLYAANDPAKLSLAEKMHNWCMTQLDTYIADSTAKGLVQAMLLGDETNLDKDLERSYADTGIIHIIAISGSNVTIFLSVISFLLWWLRDKKQVWIKYAIAFPFIWFYIVMAGAPPSAVRAGIMFSVLAVGLALQRNNNSLNTLFATAFVLLCADPQWLFSLGFQLSFVAVLSIILFYAPVYKWFAPKHKVIKWLWSAVAASIAAEVLVAPLVIYYFHTFPLLFAVSNAAAFMFMGIVLILSIVIIVFSGIPVVAHLLGWLAVWLITWFDKIVVVLQRCNPVSFHFLMLTGAELLLLYIVIVGILLFVLRRQKLSLFTGLAATCLLLLLLCHDEWHSLHQGRLVMYNTTKANHIEWIEGKTYTAITADTGKSKSYTVVPAHTAWRAWRNSNSAARNVYDIEGKTVLILNEDITGSTSFPVDYLLINTPTLPDAGKLKSIYTPSIVVLGNKYRHKEHDEFLKEAVASGIMVYDVNDKGAFVLDGGK